MLCVAAPKEAGLAHFVVTRGDGLAHLRPRLDCNQSNWQVGDRLFEALFETYEPFAVLRVALVAVARMAMCKIMCSWRSTAVEGCQGGMCFL